MKKMLFIINPITAKGVLSPYIIDIIDTFIKAGYEVSSYVTQSKDDAQVTANSRGSEFDTIICAGGDGTLNGVIAGVFPLEKKPNIGYIPAGTTNDFANSWGIPKNPADAAQSIVSTEPVRIDVSVFCNRPFIYVAAFGAFTAVSYETPQSAKNSLGRTAYIFEGIKSLTAIHPWHMKITHDNGIIEGDFVYGMVSNTRSVGGFPLKMKNDISISDGLMELILIRQPQNHIDNHKMIGAVLAQDINSEYISFVHTSHISFEASEEIPWTVDGEYGGSVKSGEIFVEQGAVNFYF